MDVEEEDVLRLAEMAECNVDQARFFLEASGGNFERAVAMFYEQRTPSGSLRRRNVLSNTNIPPRPPAPGILGGAAPRHHGGPFRLLGTVLTLPITVFGIGIRVIGVAAGVAGAVARAVLPAPIANALGGAGRALLRGPPQVDPTAAAVCFKTEFNRNYVPDGAAEGDAAEGDHSSSNNSINWLQCGWRQALSRAHSEGRFLFVYLHSPQHQATESYCKDTLLDSIVLEKLNNNSNPSSSSGTGGGSGAGCGFLCWGGDIRRSDAFALSASLRVGGYPYAAVLAYSGPRTRMISCAEGPLTSVELAALLQRALDDYSGLLWQERIEREQREMDRRLREEQDAEYQRSLEADRERDRVREEREKERREAEERERRGAEEVAAAEREAVEREERRVRVIKDRREAKRMTLPPEPTPTTRTTSRIQEEEEEEEGSSSAVAITLVRIKLPSGSQQQRRFYASQQLQAIFDWVDTLEEVEVIKYSLASPYPRRVYKVDDGDGGGGGTLEELGLVGQAVLLLQPEDD